MASGCRCSYLLSIEYSNVPNFAGDHSNLRRWVLQRSNKCMDIKATCISPGSHSLIPLNKRQMWKDGPWMRGGRCASPPTSVFNSYSRKRGDPHPSTRINSNYWDTANLSSFTEMISTIKNKNLTASFCQPKMRTWPCPGKQPSSNIFHNFHAVMN